MPAPKVSNRSGSKTTLTFQYGKINIRIGVKPSLVENRGQYKVGTKNTTERNIMKDRIGSAVEEHIVAMMIAKKLNNSVET
jgi:hypothetical protein